MTGSNLLSPRVGVLDEARELITSDRNNQYGPPTQDFARTAAVLTALGYQGPNGTELMPHDVAILMAALKLSRLMWSPQKRDSWVDLAGYAACGYECVVEYEEDNNASSKEDDICQTCFEPTCVFGRA